MFVEDWAYCSAAYRLLAGQMREADVEIASYLSQADCRQKLSAIEDKLSGAIADQEPWQFGSLF